MKNSNFIFIGTSEFAALILENLIKNNWQPSFVITQPDKKEGRKQIITPPPVKKVAQQYKISLEQPERIENLKLRIENLKPDLIIVAAFGQIIPKDILNIPPKGVLNVHPSILSLYRGPSPIQTAILNGDKKTGTTIIKMDEKIDHGPILAQDKIAIEENETALTLTIKLAGLSSKLIIKTIPLWLEDKIDLRPQDEKRATFTKIINKKDGQIDWSEKAINTERKIRSYYPWPGAYSHWQRKLLKILEADVYSDNFGLKPGQVFKTERDEIAVATGEKALLIKKLQLEGKNPLFPSDFLRGYPQIIGSILK